MARPTTTFSLAVQPEVFFSTTATSRAIRRHLAAGEVRQIAGRLYTRNLTDPVEDVVRRRVWDIAAGYFPGATIVDRTAFDTRPAQPDGAVFLCGPTRRVVRLPGVVLNCRRGPSPADGARRARLTCPPPAPRRSGRRRVEPRNAFVHW